MSSRKGKRSRKPLTTTRVFSLKTRVELSQKRTVNCVDVHQIQQSNVLRDNNSNDPSITGDQVPSSRAEDDTRAALSLFGWLKRPQPILPPNYNRQRLSKNIDNVSKILFPLSFGLFVAAYFLTYAVIKPTHSENWELLSNGYTN
ncbi:glutamate-gated chloride channel [Trichonephila clavipes]|nr:glutamate-gated chloride channel [Trichonephila clavipes]